MVRWVGDVAIAEATAGCYSGVRYTYGADLLESSSVERDLGVLGDDRVTMSQQRALAARRPVGSWGALIDEWAAGRGRFYSPSALP